MINVIADWPRRVIWPWLHAREATPELDRWDVFADSDHDEIQGLVRSDLVPWVLRWSPPALELLRRALSLGLTSQSAHLERASSELVVTSEALELIWWPLWEGVFGGEPDEFAPGELNLVETSEERFAIENELFGGWFVPPDPVEVWEWLRPARAAEVVLRMNARSGIGLYSSWEASLRWMEELERVHKHQGRVAIDAAAHWFRSWHSARWRPPAEGLVETERGGSRVLSNPWPLVFATPSMAVRAPRPRWYELLADGTKVEPSKFTPMSDLVDALVDAAQALGISQSDLLSMAAASRGLGVERPSNCDEYVTWAVVAEATQEALDNDLLLSFWAEEP